jgi:hypothetical protein
MSGASVKTPKYDLKQLEETYSGWVKEAEDKRSKNISSTRARLSASGLKEGAELWTKSIEDLESAHMKYLDELKGTETYKLIQDIKEKEKERSKKKDPGKVFDLLDPGEERGVAKVAALVPGANVAGSIQSAANLGDERAINILEKEAKQAGRGYYFLGGRKVILDGFGGGPGSGGISAMGAATAI